MKKKKVRRKANKIRREMIQVKSRKSGVIRREVKIEEENEQEVMGEKEE